MATYAYIENNRSESVVPSFEEDLTEDQEAFRDSMKKGYLTRDESIYYGSKQFELKGVPIREY